jgi:hypothetical protein
MLWLVAGVENLIKYKLFLLQIHLLTATYVQLLLLSAFKIATENKFNKCSNIAV